MLEKGGFVSGKCLRMYHFSDFKEINLVRGKAYEIGKPRRQERGKRMTMDAQICICPYTSPSICDFLESMDFAKIASRSIKTTTWGGPIFIKSQHFPTLERHVFQSRMLIPKSKLIFLVFLKSMEFHQNRINVYKTLLGAIQFS